MWTVKVTNMKREDREYIARQLLANVAPAHEGIVSLNEAHRLFSDFGSRNDLEGVLKAFVKEGIARRHEVQGDILYVFTQLASEAGKKYQSSLDALEKESQNLNAEVSSLEKELQAATSLRQLWTEGWENSNLDRASQQNIRNYVSQQLQPHLQRLEGLITAKKSNLNTLTEKAEQLRSKLQTSFPEAKDQ